MAKEKAKPKRTPGEIEVLPSGSLRVKLDAGIDPISKDRVYLRETVPAGPDADKEAEQILVRFRNEVYERRHPRTNATVERARSKVVYLPIDHQEQRRRVTNRFATNPDQTFHMTDVELAQWRSQFQAPDDEELHGSAIPPAPTGHQTWSSWASQRWPSLPDQYVAP